MARFLVIGASGLIGRHALRVIGPANAVGTFHRHPFEGGVHFDVVRDSLDDLLERIGTNFSHALVLGANSNIDACASDPEGSERLNVAGMIRVIDALAARGIVPIFASSDAVYGSGGMWRESDQAVPVLTYGRQKLAVERRLATLRSPWIAVRICKVLDPELRPAGVLGPWIADLLAGKKIRCATDQRFCPIGIGDVVDAVVALAQAGSTGVFNLGGKDPVRRIELLRSTIAAVRRHADIAPQVEECSIRDFPFVEARPFDTTVSIDKLASTIGFDPQPLGAVCARAAERHFSVSPSAIA